MNREVHVRICGGPGVRFPRATRRGPVRTPILRVSSGSWLPGRDRRDLQHAAKRPRAKRVWALDADLAAAFDKSITVGCWTLLGSFPARDMIRDWLNAGVFERGKGFAPTEEGTPQGGVISPVAP